MQLEKEIYVKFCVAVKDVQIDKNLTNKYER